MAKISFPKLKIIKNYLRNSTGNKERLHILSLLAKEVKFAKDVEKRYCGYRN